ncbi:hypothetical protein SVIO_025260 [Streptomyces violaceusniger]|uniref:Polysaccharide biosynthesis protein C-terminal domain-containing protein n=1 Tax=Streptomyces violaceusniger TaxID=68280 RepID=A0A4D4L1N7_STRVO|nr:hypothetical protein SVIO_025260 [Streptomyces violaceusniger]
MITTLLAPVPDSTTRLGTEPVGRLLWRACTQTTAAVGVYGVYALTNAWFVGHGVGDTAMAAVNLAAPLLLLLGAVSTTVGAGGASLVSRALGPATGRPPPGRRATPSPSSGSVPPPPLRSAWPSLTRCSPCSGPTANCARSPAPTP